MTDRGQKSAAKESPDRKSKKVDGKRQNRPDWIRSEPADQEEWKPPGDDPFVARLKKQQQAKENGGNVPDIAQRPSRQLLLPAAPGKAYGPLGTGFSKTEWRK